MMFGKFFMAIPIAALALGSTTACATKKFVRTSVGEVNDKVDSVGRSLDKGLDDPEEFVACEGFHCRGSRRSRFLLVFFIIAEIR